MSASTDGGGGKKSDFYPLRIPARGRFKKFNILETCFQNKYVIQNMMAFFSVYMLDLLKETALGTRKKQQKMVAIIYSFTFLASIVNALNGQIPEKDTVIKSVLYQNLQYCSCIQLLQRGVALTATTELATTTLARINLQSASLVINPIYAAIIQTLITQPIIFKPEDDFTYMPSLLKNGIHASSIATAANFMLNDSVKKLNLIKLLREQAEQITYPFNPPALVAEKLTDLMNTIEDATDDEEETVRVEASDHEVTRYVTPTTSPR
jgi:hypothetical protein